MTNSVANEDTANYGFSLLHLCSVAFSLAPANIQFLSAIDKSKLLRFAQKNKLEILSYQGLLKAIEQGLEIDNTLKKEWEHAYLSALRFGLLQDHERSIVIKQLNESGIPFALLKGSAIKAYYPRPETRQMCDFDFYYIWSTKNSENLRTVLEKNGYTITTEDGWVHETYKKPPYFTVEPHHALFSIPEWIEHFNHFQDKLHRANASGSQLKMALTDLYVTNTAHAIKHLVHGGIGPRCLIDIYVLRALNASSIDEEYIKEEMSCIGSLDVDSLLWSISQKTLENDPAKYKELLTQPEADLLAVILESGLFGKSSARGTLAKAYYPKLEGGGTSRFRYLAKRLNPGKATIKAMYPIVSEKPYLYSLFVAKRLFSSTKKLRNIMQEIKGLVEN